MSTVQLLPVPARLILEGNEYFFEVSKVIKTPLPTPDLPAGKIGTLIPLYIFPGSQWQRLINVQKANKEVPMIAVINPNSGAGAGKMPEYSEWIPKLKEAGIRVIGYVSTDYARRSIDLVKAEIDRYFQWYPLDGIFFDEMRANDDAIQYYKDAHRYVQSRIVPPLTVGNPGVVVSKALCETVTITVIYEREGLANMLTARNDFPKERQSIIPHNAPFDRNWITRASDGVGWIYTTDDRLPNPWDALPTYFEQMVALLKQLGGQ